MGHKQSAPYKRIKRPLWLRALSCVGMIALLSGLSIYTWLESRNDTLTGSFNFAIKSTIMQIPNRAIITLRIDYSEDIVHEFHGNIQIGLLSVHDITFQFTEETHTLNLSIETSDFERLSVQNLTISIKGTITNWHTANPLLKKAYDINQYSTIQASLSSFVISVRWDAYSTGWRNFTTKFTYKSSFIASTNVTLRCDIYYTVTLDESVNPYAWYPPAGTHNLGHFESRYIYASNLEFVNKTSISLYTGEGYIGASIMWRYDMGYDENHATYPLAFDIKNLVLTFGDNQQLYYANCKTPIYIVDF